MDNENLNHTIGMMMVAAFVLYRLVGYRYVHQFWDFFDFQGRKQRQEKWTAVRRDLCLESFGKPDLNRYIDRMPLNHSSWNGSTEWLYALCKKINSAQVWLAEFRFEYHRNSNSLSRRYYDYCTVLIAHNPDWRWNSFSLKPIMQTEDTWFSMPQPFAVELAAPNNLDGKYSTTFQDLGDEEKLLMPEVKSFLKQMQPLYWEGAGEYFLFYFPNRDMTAHEIILFYRDAMRLTGLFTLDYKKR